LETTNDSALIFCEYCKAIFILCYTEYISTISSQIKISEEYVKFVLFPKLHRGVETAFKGGLFPPKFKVG